MTEIGEQQWSDGDKQPDEMHDVADDLTAERALQRTVVEGEKRSDRSFVPMVATGVVGGLDVGTGVLALLLVEADTHSKLLGALAFSVGFIALLLARSELFTENFLVPVVSIAAGRTRVGALLRLWGVAAVSNLAGGWLFMIIVIGAFPRLHATIIEVGSVYAGLGFGWRSFALGLLGGLVITLMTWMQHSTDAVVGKLAVAITTAFLLAAGGLNHAIVASLFMFGALQAGASSFGYLHWFLEFLFAAGTNILGGVGLVTVLRVLQVPERLAAERQEAP